MPKTAGALLAIGVIERDPSGTLYCTLLYFGPDGTLLGKHRKLKPTAAERLIWGEGDGSTLTVLDTELGKIGGLICWENYMPLARMAMYSKGVGIYLAPTADTRDAWQATMRHIACEGRTFVLGCNQFLTKSMYPSDLEGIEDLAGQPEILCRGGSAIISPLGEVISRDRYTMRKVFDGRARPVRDHARQARLRCRRSLRAARCVQAHDRRTSVALGDTRSGLGRPRHLTGKAAARLR